MLNIFHNPARRVLLLLTIAVCIGLGEEVMAQSKAEILPGRIVVRMAPGTNPDYLNPTQKSARGSKTNAEIREIKPAIPWIRSSSSARSAQHPLSDIYFLELTDPDNLEAMIASLNERSDILYAEPYYLFTPLHTPNDPLSADQEHIDLIRARDAWGLEKGDSTLVIGILDSGINLVHPDLADNLAINPNDPINGIDDDGDGLVDNRYGWDIADNDNNPSDDTDGHGTWVSGVSSARTNNNIGISGTGYNSKILPIKIFQSNSNNFSNGYEAIALAADLGCDVINLSWGAEAPFSQFGQDVIDYAVLVQDAAIVAAAGNTNGLRDFYPASFRYVLSVASTDNSDLKAPWATYSRNVDITAPGVAILTTNGSDDYIRKQGSSLSAPQVAGAVALVRARYPQLNAIQAMERVRVNSDPIDDLPGNQAFAQFIGKGRLNMFAALANITSPAVRISGIDINNGAGDVVFYGDSVRIKLELTNYLYHTNNLGVTLKTSSPYVSIVKNTINLGVINTLEKKSPQQEFIVILADDTPANEKIYFTLEYKDGTYDDYEHFEITTAPDWVTIESDQLAFSIAGNGNLGFASDLFSDGEGITYQNEPVLKNIAFLISSNDVVADNLPGNLILPFRDNDFSNDVPIKLKQNSIADHYAVSEFKTKNALSTLDVTVEQELLAWDDNDAMILEYRVTNIGNSALEDLAIGFFADFDLTDPAMNHNYWIDSLNLSVTENSDGTLFSGIATIQGPASVHFAIDKRNANGNISDLPGTITDEVKRNLLYDLDPKQAAGTSGGGNDVASMLISKIPALNSKTSENITIAISAASSLSELISNIREAQQHYQQFRINPPTLYTAEYCPGDVPLIDPPGEIFNFYRDPFGNELISTGIQLSSPGLDTLNTIYATSVTDNITSDVFSIPVRKSLLNIGFDIDPDTVILDENNNTLVHFTDLSTRPVSWNWTFSNGYTSTRESPAIHFTTEGLMSITLEATNNIGCTEELTRTLPVIARTPRPQGQYVAGCGDLNLEIAPQSNFVFRLYSDREMTTVLDEADRFSFTGIDKDSTLYITQTAPGGIESLAAPIEFDKFELNTDFIWYQDSTNLSTASLLHFNSESGSNDVNWYVRPNGGMEEWIGFGSNASYNYAGIGDFTIIHEVTNTEGCTGRVEENFSPAAAISPAPVNAITCGGSNYLLNPGNSFYHFYSTNNILLHKGSSFDIAGITRDTVIYFSDASGLLESDLSAATIEVSTINAEFELPSSPYNMAFNLPLALRADASVTSADWYVNGNLIGSGTEISHSFTAPGTYQIRLEAMNELGCSESFSSILEVVNITGIEDPQITDNSIFPNPANTHITVDLPGIKKISAFDTRGRKVHTWQEPEAYLSVASLQPGIYIFLIQTDFGDFRNKVIIAR